jgi:hypothetical protein
MFTPFFRLAAVSPTRRRAFQTLVLAHLATLAILYLRYSLGPPTAQPMMLGNVLLIMGIVEGALVVGWRLTQMPKSQALEFLLVSQMTPPYVFLAETLVGLARLTLLTLAGLPMLSVMVSEGMLHVEDLPVLLLMPWTWGAVTGLGMAVWAYESATVRRWGERFAILMILFYLLVGVLIGENLPILLREMPGEWGSWMLRGLFAVHEYNPFGVMRYAMDNPPYFAWPRLAGTTLAAFAVIALLAVRGARRLHGHFHDEHYRPVILADGAGRPAVGDQPLTWWALKRVSRYAGSINLWLAGGFGLVYAAYTVAGDDWPVWLGRQVFVIFDNVGGIPMVATSLLLLATVPAAFQYGLWDSNSQDRCRRLELLLLTGLDGRAYWHAAAAAAWKRGRGYFVIATILWLASCIAGRTTVPQLFAALAAGAMLWGLYFTLGFRAFSRGMQANNLGMFLTLLLPLATYLVAQNVSVEAAAWLPPGGVYFGATQLPGLSWMLGPLAAGLLTLYLAKRSLAGCDADLRRWYNANHGLRAAE